MKWMLLVALALAGDAPEISRSVGKKGGVVVLWPRVTPSGAVDHAQAARVQQALTTVAQAAGYEVDVRPEPERVCPRETGCKGVALGAVISAAEGGCVVVATVSAPGQSAATLVPWVGQVRLKAAASAFREPPESQVVITDYARCADLDLALGGDTANITSALKAAGGM